MTLNILSQLSFCARNGQVWCANTIPALTTSLLEQARMATPTLPLAKPRRKVGRATLEVHAGAVIGRWSVKGPGKQPEHWLCECTCGTRREVRRANLRRGSSLSCGCVGTERLLDIIGAKPGSTKRPEYNVWSLMKRRCTDPNDRSYQDYGRRGITVCKRWRDDFAAFLADVGPRPGPGYTLERRDNDGPYEPGNVVWATAIEQANNKSNNKIIAAFGRSMTQAQWARETDIPVKTLYFRLSKGWTPEEALTRPVRNTRRRRTTT